MTEKEKLLPCPFCGEQPQTNYFKDKMGSVATVKCVNEECITRDPICVEKVSMKMAIKAWNTRTRIRIPSTLVAIPKEKGACDAPCQYHNDEAYAWANGYNSCLNEVGAQAKQEVSEEAIFKIIEKTNWVSSIAIVNGESVDVRRKLAKAIADAVKRGEV